MKCKYCNGSGCCKCDGYGNTKPTIEETKKIVAVLLSGVKIKVR